MYTKTIDGINTICLTVPGMFFICCLLYATKIICIVHTNWNSLNIFPRFLMRWIKKAENTSMLESVGEKGQWKCDYKVYQWEASNYT